MEMKKMQKGGDTIRLNAMSVVSLLSGIIKKFREEEPDAAFVVTDQKESTDWHLCILSAGPGISYQGGQELLSEEVFLGASSRTWLGERDEISLRDVENENFILLPRGTVLRNLADTRFREHHFIPRLSMECNSTHLVRSLVSDQVGDHPVAGIFLGKTAGCTYGEDRRAGILPFCISPAAEKRGDPPSGRAVCPVCRGLYENAGA